MGDERESPFLRGSSRKHRLVFVAADAITPLGLNLQQTCEAIGRGESGIRRLDPIPYNDIKYEEAGERDGEVVYRKVVTPGDRFDVSPVKIGAPIVRTYNPKDYFTRSELRQTSRATQFADVSFRGALAQAPHIKIDEGFERDMQKAVVIGTSAGGMVNLHEMGRRLDAEGAGRHFTFAPRILLTDQVTSFTGNKHKFKGPNFGVSAACATGSIAVTEAEYIINFSHAGRGRVGRNNPLALDAYLAAVGAAEAPLLPDIIAYFASLGALSWNNENPEEACRPFDKGRIGFVMAEGGAIMMVQTLESAEAQGANIIAELVGFSNTSDANHPTDPDHDTVLYTMRTALARAGFSAKDLSMVKAHATSTPNGDDNESRAIASLLRKRRDRSSIYETPVTAPKGHIGHLVGAAGAAEIAIVLWLIKNQKLMANKNLVDPIRDDLNFVLPQTSASGELSYLIDASVDLVLCNSFGFGGLNSSAVLQKYQKGNLSMV